MSQSQHLSGGIRSSEKGVGKLLAVRFLLRVRESESPFESALSSTTWTAAAHCQW